MIHMTQRDTDIIKGRAWVFGDYIDTDQIIQGKYLTLLDYREMARHALEIPRADFARSVRRGDIVVAGKNMGGGSSREEAPMVLRELGVGCLIAESFARIFYRNCFNIGLPAIVVPQVTQYVHDGDEITISLSRGELVLPDGRVLMTAPLPEFMMRILNAGGAVNLYKSQHGDQPL